MSRSRTAHTERAQNEVGPSEAQRAMRGPSEANEKAIRGSLEAIRRSLEAIRGSSTAHQARCLTSPGLRTKVQSNLVPGGLNRLKTENCLSSSLRATLTIATLGWFAISSRAFFHSGSACGRGRGGTPC